MRFSSPFFKEFVVRTSKDIDRLLAHCRSRGLMAGIPLRRWSDELRDCLLIAVTEKRTRAEIDALVSALKDA
jgi:glycine dehydrogenase subunit 1